jgi:hypothetical protein
MDYYLRIESEVISSLSKYILSQGVFPVSLYLKIKWKRAVAVLWGNTSRYSLD